MTTFAKAARTAGNKTVTTNGMAALKSTTSYNVDLFGSIGASRGKDITALFSQAFAENPEWALRVALWGRDVRSGAGERKLFRDILQFLEKHNPRYLLETNFLAKVPELGRWDDLLVFTDRDVKLHAFSLIRRALIDGNGLAAKWMPRKGIEAAELRNFLGWTPKYYRKRLVSLTKVVETQMCNREFESINFSHVPSLAMSRYTKAFAKRAPEAFTEFKSALKKGTDPKVKINAGAVYPYDIIKNLRVSRDESLCDSQWDALPNFIGNANVLPVVDVSDSMTCKAGGGSYSYTSNRDATVTCLDVAISLGMYCASKNTGKFKDLFVTFTSQPAFVTLSGTLSQRYNQMARAKWEGSTDLEAAMKLVLNTAIQNRVPQSEMPSVILILSDMQFNSCITYGARSYDYRRGYTNANPRAIEMIREEYAKAGYTAPQVVFWNINDAGNKPVTHDEQGTALVSGFSPAIMKSILSADLKNMTPEGIMLKTIMQEKYDFH